MTTARGGLGVVVANGKIYAIGGLNGSSLPLNINEEYNPSTNRWSNKMAMPTARSGFAIAAYQNKIYVMGGTFGNGYVANTEVYDPVKDIWETKASMPTPRADLTACVVNDKIYLIGGKSYTNTAPFYRETGINAVYDPATDTWETKTSLPTPVFGYSSVVIDEKIYIIGGSRASGTQGSTVVVSSTQVYNTQTDEWSLAANLPAKASYGAAGATVGFMAPTRIHFIGGYFAEDFSMENKIYNPEINSWSDGVLMSSARAYFGIAVISDMLYAIGGFNGENWLDTIERYSPPGYGTIPPDVQILSPENRTYTDVTLIFKINRGAEWIGYSLDSQSNITLKGETALAGLADGSHRIVLYANDSFGNMGSHVVYFSVDNTPPEIVILYPQNQSYDTTDIQLIFTIDEPVSELAYSLNQKEPVPIIGNVTLPALLAGSHSLTVYATDELGNSSSETVYFSITPFPIITLAAISATITIALSTGYIFYKRRK
jgi:hypothetical protein